MMTDYILEVGDLLMRSDEVGVVSSISETPYGLIYSVHWTWTLEGFCGVTNIPCALLCKPFFDKFTHIKRSKSEQKR